MRQSLELSDEFLKLGFLQSFAGLQEKRVLASDEWKDEEGEKKTACLLEKAA